jgi:hypothetical protein
MGSCSTDKIFWSIWNGIFRGLDFIGFYTTRFVEGNTPDEARSIALDLIGKDAELKEMVFNDLDDPPVFLIEGLEELSSDMEAQTNPGFSFYVDHSIKGKNSSCTDDSGHERI